MGWCDGCRDRPPVGEGAERVVFDFGVADEVGAALERARAATEEDLRARAVATPALVDWGGSYRDRFDQQRGAQEAVVVAAGIPQALASLRRAWDAAAEAQQRANARAAAEAAAEAAARAAAEAAARAAAAASPPGG
ncbi:MAG: hypothetical protein HYX34_12050 [Actinobacteria bacterium]|nr:hypothetical protein [Actinomycetota bacterium]